VQLSAGVRLLTAQVHEYSNNGITEWHLCHSVCALLDAGKLSDWLSEIKTWMDANPSDVVTIVLVNSNDATAQDLKTEYETSGIDAYAYTPTSASTPATANTWPTLNTLISANTRLLTFVANLPAASNTVAPYLMDEFTYLFENPYSVTAANNFTCTPDRPSSVVGSPSAALNSNRLFLMNHFLDQSMAFGIETPAVDNITSTNSPDETGNVAGSLGAHAVECQATYAKAPNYVLVDFFNVGPAMQTVDNMNGVRNAEGRKAVSAAAVQEFEGMAVGGMAGKGNSMAALAVVVAVAVVGSL